MSSIMTLLGLNEWTGGQNKPHIPVNTGVALGLILHVSVVEKGTETPPGSPSEGDAYILGAMPTGDWSSFSENDIAYYHNGAWQVLTPIDRLAACVEDGSGNTDVWLYDGGTAAWVKRISGGGDNVASGTVTARSGDIDFSGGSDGDVLAVQANGSLAVETAAGADPDTLYADTTDELQVGYSHAVHDLGTTSSGTLTPNESDGAMQKTVNGGAFTLAPPTNDTSILLKITNNASAGAITTSGFTITTGDSFTTTDTHKFVCNIDRIDGETLLHVRALQ